jgi:chromosome segregation ATPase
MAMGDVSDDLEQVQERALKYAAEADRWRKAFDSLHTQLGEVQEQRDNLAGLPFDCDRLTKELQAMTEHCSRQREELQELQTTLANVTQSRDVLMMQVHDLQAEVERRAQPDNDVAVVAAHLKGVRDGKGLAFREVHNWLRPFVGAGAEDAAALLDAVPGLVKRLAECEGVTI